MNKKKIVTEIIFYENFENSIVFLIIIQNSTNFVENFEYFDDKTDTKLTIELLPFALISLEFINHAFSPTKII